MFGALGLQNLREAPCKGPDFAPKSGPYRVLREDFGLRESEIPNVYVCA